MSVYRLVCALYVCVLYMCSPPCPNIAIVLCTQKKSEWAKEFTFPFAISTWTNLNAILQIEATPAKLTQCRVSVAM